MGGAQIPPKGDPGFDHHRQTSEASTPPPRAPMSARPSRKKSGASRRPSSSPAAASWVTLPSRPLSCWPAFEQNPQTHRSREPHICVYIYIYIYPVHTYLHIYIYTQTYTHHLGVCLCVCFKGFFLGLLLKGETKGSPKSDAQPRSGKYELQPCPMGANSSYPSYNHGYTRTATPD